MATSAQLVPLHDLSDEEKEVLVERCLDLVFVDDVTELSCKRCRRVLIHHYVANCGHLFCKNCKRVLSDGRGWKCPECKEYITHIGEHNSEVELQVFGLMVHCLNYKYGCQQIMPLRLITKHLECCEDTKEANLPRLLFADTYSIESIVSRMEAMSERMNGLMETISQLKETQDYLIQKIKEADDKQRLENEIKWYELENRISADLQRETKLQSQITDSHTEIIKDLHAKLFKMEERAHQQTAEIERMDEKIQQFQNATDIKIKSVDDKQRENAERMKQKMERWKNNILIETTKSQTQTEERCNQKITEKVTHVEQRLEKVESKQSDVECKINNLTREMSMGLETLRADTLDNVSSKIVELQHYHDKITSELDSKWTNEMDNLRDKLEMVQSLPNDDENVEHQVEELDQSQTKINNNLTEKLQQMEGKIEECNSSQRQDFQIKLDQFSAEIRQSLDDMKGTMAQTSQEQGERSYLDEPNDNTSQCSQMQSPEEDMVPCYNILLLGESGSGKSLFINSFANYIHHDQLSDALAAPPTPCIVPTSVVVTDRADQGKQIYFGNSGDTSDPNEHLATAACTAYIFNFDNFLVRFIDCPGFRRLNSVDDDNTLKECILQCVSQCNFMVNAVAIVAKSDQPQLNPQLEGFVQMLVCEVDNVFVFLSHSGTTDFEPGDIIRPLKQLLKDSAHIKLTKDNVFCFDNKGFQYLLAVQSEQGMDVEFEDSYHDAWTRSAQQCYRLMHLLKRTPHCTRGLSKATLDRLMARLEAWKCSQLCLHFLTETAVSKFRNEAELRCLISYLESLKLNESKIYECMSESCPMRQKTETELCERINFKTCPDDFRSSWLSWSKYCNCCHCEFKHHVEIDDSKVMKELNQKKEDLKKKQTEWHRIREISEELDGISKHERVGSTNSDTVLGQVSSEGGGDSDESHTIDRLTLENVIKIKKEELLKLKFYGLQMKEYFEKLSKQSNRSKLYSEVYVPVGNNLLTKELQET